jgi:hypothetical protein
MGCIDWIDLAQNRDTLESSCEFGIEPSGSIKYRDNIEFPNN